MCGITGFIGSSKNKDLSFELLTKLFEGSESRGIDAAGFWATSCGINGSVIYHKEPIKASKFVKKQFWRNFSKADPDLVIAHARGASRGVGEPFFNENNHPFTSADKTIAVAHNGRIEDSEYHQIRNMYEVNTACDSEILLRIFESHLDPESQGLEAIKQIFSLINEGHMAVAIGQRGGDGSRSLWLFRNEYRPLWVSDMRDELGQIFFVSEPSIWEDACKSCRSKVLSSCYKLIEINPQEVWRIDLEDREIASKRYIVEKEGESEVDENTFFRIPIKEPYFELETNLDKNDQIIREEAQIWNEFDVKKLHASSRKIVEKIKNIESELTYMVSRDLIDKDKFKSLVNQLELQEKEVSKILLLLYSS